MLFLHVIFINKLEEQLTRMRIIFLGEQFSYHHLAGIAFWGEENDFIPATNFESIIESVVSGKADHGIIAVENSLAGDVPGNFELLCSSPLEICGEISLKIELQLAAIPGASLNQLETVYSHKMAIRESSAFFSRYPMIQFEETVSTSSAVKFVAEQNSMKSAAIGSKTAIKFYKLIPLATSITNSAENITRFLVLRNKSLPALTTYSNVKASLLLQSDKSDVLISMISDMLQNEKICFRRSIKDGYIYVELILTNNFQFDNTLHEMKEKGISARVLGVYNAGITREGF